jgi:hypothetical protein
VVNYVLSDQDLDDIFWEIDNLAWRLKDKIGDKFIHDLPYPDEEEQEGD